VSKISPYLLNGHLVVADRQVDGPQQLDSTGVRSVALVRGLLAIVALVAMTADEPVLAGRRRLMEECGDGCRVREEAA
jgi:hypothetical protein